MILKNTDIIDHQWASIVVLAGNQYTIQEVDKLRFLTDSSFLDALDSGIAVVNDNVVDVDKNTARELLKNKDLIYIDTYDASDSDLAFSGTLEII